MASGFVSGGTADAPIERNDEWLKAQQEVEANRQRKAEQAQQNEGKSLFEVLEANKAAKEEAFQDANKLKNQFRALDEDEIDFLDSVLESTRAEENRVKRETAEGLKLFRRQQEEAARKVREDDTGARSADADDAIAEEKWVTGPKKRKILREKESSRRIKMPRSSSSTEAARLSSDLEKVVSKPDGQTEGLISIETNMNEGPLKMCLEPRRIEAAAATRLSISPKNVGQPKVKQTKSIQGLVNYDSDESDGW